MNDELPPDDTNADEPLLDPADAPLGEDSLAVLGGDAAGPMVPAVLGAQRYVLAGFFAAGIGVAFVVSRTFAGVWGALAGNPWVSQHIAALSRTGEEDRGAYGLVVGALAGALASFYAYRRQDVRVWTDEVAAELAKVSWPSKADVTNGTMIVVFAGAFATTFLALLDRFWGFVTDKVYGL